MKLLSIKQYAAIAKISRQAVSKQIKSNKLPDGYRAENVDGFWVIIKEG